MTGKSSKKWSVSSKQEEEKAEKAERRVASGKRKMSDTASALS
jgi:hypothetical protein